MRKISSNSDERVLELARYIIETDATVRATGAKFGISKSTVHKDITLRLRQLNHALYLQVEKVLQKNKNERHLRGGEATKNKYLAAKKARSEK